jgi:microcystin-dependent protein
MLMKRLMLGLVLLSSLSISVKPSFALDAFLGEVRFFAGNYCPTKWEAANGQILQISFFPALFSVLGTTYGGDGRTTFALPDLRARFPLGAGESAPLLTDRRPGEQGGQEEVTLLIDQMPAHTHTLMGAPIPGNTNRLNGAALSRPKGNDPDGTDPHIDSYSTIDPTVGMDAKSIAFSGGSFPHPNMPPYLVLQACICIDGVFPDRQ